MADRHRIGTFNAGGRFGVLLDLEDGTSAQFVRNAFKVTPYAKTAIFSKAGRRYGGSRQVGETHDNGLLEGTWLLGTGASADSTLAKFDDLVELVEGGAQNLFYEWRPDGATRSTYFAIRAMAPWDVQYEWIVFVGTRQLVVKAGFIVEPLAYGDPMDIVDDFSVDSLADYTFDLGSGTVAVSGGRMTESSSSEKRFYHSARGYEYADAQVTVKVTTGAAVTNGAVGVILKRTGPNDFIIARVGGGYSSLVISKWVANTPTTLTSGGGSIPANTTKWIRGSTEGNVVTAELWASEPTPLGTPEVTVSYTLTASEAALFGTGVTGEAGIRWTPNTVANDETIDDYEVKPYTYVRSGTQTIAAHEFTLPSIPGTAPAKVDVETSISDSSQSWRWPLFGWALKEGVDNYVWNGHFEGSTLGTGGWSAAGTGTLTNAATSITRVTTASKFGSASAEIVCPATAFSGPNFKLYRRFRKGVTYSFSLWVRAASATTTVQVRFGNNAAGDFGSTNAVALSTAWQQVTGTWTPTADRDDAHFCPVITAATATTWQIDGAVAYEGTTAPTGKQAEGVGGVAPLGLIEAESASLIETTSGTFAITADATGSGGYTLNFAAVPASAACFAYYELDPSLLSSDLFADEVTIEFYARIKPNSNLSGMTAQIRASAVSQSTGGIIGGFIESDRGLYTAPVSGANAMTTRLGALTLPVDAANRPRYQIQVRFFFPSTASGAFAFDYLVAVPARQRAAGATARLGSFIDAAQVVSGGTTKTVLSDLRGLLTQNPGIKNARAVGLGGQVLQLPPGSPRFISKIAPSIPDYTGHADASIAPGTATHFAVWPRYHLVRSG